MRPASCLLIALSILMLFFAGCGKDKEGKAAVPSFGGLASREHGVQVFEKRHHEQAQEEDRPLRIGVIGSRTGEESGTGRMTFEGVEIAASKINSEGGIEGKPLELVPIDDKGDPETAKKALESLVEEKVAAIIGAPTGWATFMPTYISNESRTVFISSGTRRNVNSSGPFSFRLSLSIESASDDLLKYAVSKGKRSFFLLTFVTDDEALNVAGALRQAAYNQAVTIKGEEGIFSADDIQTAIEKLNDCMPVDAVLFAGPPAIAAQFMREAKNQGIRVPMIGGEELYNNDFIKAGAAVEGSLLYAGFSPKDKEPETVAFTKSFAKRYGRLPDRIAAEAYDSFILLAEAIRNAGTTKPSLLRQAIIETSGFRGVTGPISFNPERESQRPSYILEVRKNEGYYIFSIVKSPH